MINDIIDSGLMGDFKQSGMLMHPDKAQDFLAELRLLMEKYEVEKIDVCWQHFNLHGINQAPPPIG